MTLRKKSNLFKLSHLRNSNKLFHFAKLHKLLTAYEFSHRTLVFIGLQG